MLSKHAGTLRDLGFTPMRILADQGEVERVVRAMGQHLDMPSPNFGKLNQPREPWYWIIDSTTLATDETGLSWQAQEAVDLSKFGFKNDTERMERLIERLGH